MDKNLILEDTMLKALELYCGVGGFAKASVGFDIEVIMAYDQNEAALQTYNANFSHKAKKFNLEQFSVALLESLHVDFLWLSPPCQPYTAKGIGLDIDDARSDSFKTILHVLSECEHPPLHVGVENVARFAESKMRDLLIKTLKDRGYNISETMLCPSQLGIPNRRLRYYLCASQKPLKKIEINCTHMSLNDFIQEPQNPIFVPEHILAKFQKGFRIVDLQEQNAYTTCFTSSYSKSWMHSGAYLASDGGVRLFAPLEIARLLGFGADFVFAEGLTPRQKYKLIGNSLSVYALKVVLKQFDL